MRALLLALAVSSCVLLPTSLFAQDAPPVPLESRVRVTVEPPAGVDGLRYVGRLTAWDDVLLRVEDEKVGTAPVYLAELERLEVSRGTKSWRGWGTLAGAALGLGVGLVIAAGTEPTPEDDIDFSKVGPPIVGTLGGALAGLLVGTALTKEKWEEVPLDGLREGDPSLITHRPPTR